MDELKDLINRTVRRILIDDDREWLVFDTDEGSLCYRAEGDCCSTSSVESITNTIYLVDSKVENIRSKTTEELPEIEERPSKDSFEDDSIHQWGYVIKTSKGICDIEFRNYSNGYYSGYLYLNEDALIENNELGEFILTFNYKKDRVTLKDYKEIV